MPFMCGTGKSAYGNIYSRRTFRTLLDVKGDAVAFAQALKTACVDCRMMDENIRSIFLHDKSKPFLIAKPLYSSILHSDFLLS